MVHILDHMNLVFTPFKASMRKIKDNPIEPSVLQVTVRLHCFHVNAMQNRGFQTFQLHYI